MLGLHILVANFFCVLYPNGMTLKNRNRVYFIASLLTTVLVAYYAGIFLYAAFRGQIIPPQNPVRLVPHISEHILFRYEFPASIASVFIFIIYVPIISLVIARGFGNTQALELVYFGGFVIACMAEGIRLLLPLFGLWQSYSILLVLTGRIIIGGRLLAFTSFLFATLFNETNQRQNAEQNFSIMLLVSFFIGVIMPLETTQTSSACTVIWGYGTLFLVIRLCLFILTEVTLIINAITKSNKELIKTAIAYPFLMAGYSILGITDNFIMLGSGAVFLLIGTVLYLKSIHSIYMWH